MTRLELTPRQSVAWMLFAALTFVGVMGRIFQPEYHVTPLAAVTLFAAMCFTRTWMVALLPIGILTISNLILPDYNNRADLIVVYACMAGVALLHGWLRSGTGWASIAYASFVPSAVFFIVTNFVVWVVRRGVVFDDSFAGLMECYDYGVPFYRWMLAGDLVYTVAVFGTYALCAQATARRELTPVRVEA